MAEDLYALPLSLLPCEPVDGCDIQYLNHSHKPIINPFKKSLDILMYNDALFQLLLLLYHLRLIILKRITVSIAVFPYLISSLSSLHKESQTQYPSRNID